MDKKIFIKTFGCAQNTADSERIKAFYWEQGYRESENWKEADLIVINTCIIRESAENRAYGLLNAIKSYELRTNKWNPKIVVTGCLVGLHNKNKKLEMLQRKFPRVDEFLPIEKISFKIDPIRNKKKTALISISSGCNNFCSYCIVPFARGKEISRPMDEILIEVDKVIENNFKEVVLIGQNVNTYGAELTETTVSMGKKRFKSNFPSLLEKVAKKNLEKISFVSSNPWDFSDDLIKVIAANKNIDRLIHLPIQAGENELLKRMNRGYTVEEYIQLLDKIRKNIDGVTISTDIIIGFPGETDEIFKKEIEVFKRCNFDIAYLNKYSPRKGTVSAKLYNDEIPQSKKRERWMILEKLINQK